jgi:hypothetical protein
VNKAEFMEENDEMYDKMVVTEAGDSPNVKEGQIITMRKLRDENSALKRKDAKLVEARQANSGHKPPVAHGYHPRFAADRELHQRGILPGDHQGAERSCRGRQGGSPGGLEGERDRGSLDPCRYRHPRLPEGPWCTNKDEYTNA